ncbi:hypothetical protein SCHPADRAFT_993795 [Schizopora paradoxa]|uniref:F-box domain-containing protein n=1 Tax=Schizopora paradoxa TaxID=27342 RepID=A0A0H2S2C6_9AGAM|nr:hypothetical protein SCHPADRAFT_993795 [Schizopora paradoxa]
MSFDDLQTVGMDGCHNLVSRARKAVQRLKPLSDTLRELASAIEAESEAACTNFKAVSNMCSLIFLPNELLSRIFHFVVHGSRNDQLANLGCTEAALTLSHVSQYFRVTATSCASLWSSVIHSSSLGPLCLSRIKDALFDMSMAVEVMGNPGEEPNELVFTQSQINYLSRSNQWRSFDIRFVSKFKQYGTLGLSKPKNREALRDINVRSLESLCIRNNADQSFMFTKYDEFQHWDTPNLRHLTSVHFFPLHLPGLSTLTNLDVILKVGFGLVDFRKQLSRLKSLESFDLKLKIERDSSLPDEFPEVLELPSVRFLKIEVTRLLLRHTAPTLKSFFSSISFPSVVDLRIKLGGIVGRQFHEDEDLCLDLSEDLGSIFHCGRDTGFPRVEDLWLEANGLNIVSGVARSVHDFKAQTGYIYLYAPLGSLPTLKHLTLGSNGSLAPSLQYSDTLLVSEYAPEDLHIVSSLETITVRTSMLAVAGMSDFVAEILRMQKRRGDWEKFRELVVVDNNYTNDARTCNTTKSKAYAGDAALHWCERRDSKRNVSDVKFID